MSHHPPVSAYQLDGPDATWRLHGWSQPAVVPVVKFYGIKTVATGARQIDFADGSSVCMTMPNFAIKGERVGGGGKTVEGVWHRAGVRRCDEVVRRVM